MNNYEEDGVLISQDAIENSLHKKAKRKQTLAQLPVYRAVGNLKYVIVGITKNAPRSLRFGENRAGDKLISWILHTPQIVYDSQGVYCRTGR